MALALAKQKVTLQLGDRLGSGGFSIVYHATERHSGRAVALKKSRVSLRVKRTLLQHEASVLKLLSGHPSIPQVFAYGRIDHFELLSMQLLHRSLGDVVEHSGPLPLTTVLDVTDQLLAALDHMHSHGVVHRDIKPDNILLQIPSSSQVCLIDFGLACRPAKMDRAKQPRPPNSDGPVSIFGTLPYASLNAHQGLDLSYRDDLESLAYTLLFLLRGSLPWSRYTEHGTTLGRLRQVHEQKKVHDGHRLASGLPAEFGLLVDYARSLSAGEVPDYAAWRLKFKQCTSHTTDANKAVQQTVPSSNASNPPPLSGSLPVKGGQLVLVQLLPAITIESYSALARHEKSYIHDSSLVSPEWSAPPRPALVLDVGWDERARLHRFTAVAIGQRRRGVAAAESDNAPSVPIAGPSRGGAAPPPLAISVTPEWPLEHSYCYVFKRPAVFYCLPSQAPTSAIWSIDAASLELLKSQLAPPRDPFAAHADAQSPDPDTRHDARMRTGSVKFFAQLSALTPVHVAADGSGAGAGAEHAIDWAAERAWFDECVKAARRHDLDDGRWWTGAAFGDGHDDADGREDEELSDSYRGDDYEEWERQQERDRSLTLSVGSRGEEGGYDVGLEELDEIVALE